MCDIYGCTLLGAKRLALDEPTITSLIGKLTIPRTGETHTIVRPGLGLAMYYAQPLYEIADAITEMAERYLAFIPADTITALGGSNAWGTFSAAKLKRQLKQLQSAAIRYTNIDLASDSLLASEGSYGWHVDGGNFPRPDLWLRETNVVFHEFPPEELERVGSAAMIDWVSGIADLIPFSSGQFGWSFNHLQRTWTTEVDAFVGAHAMRFLGFDIMEPDLARVARGLVPNCSWLTLLGTDIVAALGGAQAVAAALSPAVGVRPLVHGLLLRAGDAPPVGDVNRGAPDLGPLREVARLTRPLRVRERVLFYGPENLRHGWVARLDD